MALVIYGRLLIFGIISSTLSAHSDGVPALEIYRNQMRASCARRPDSPVDHVMNVAASYARYSSDLQDDSSITQQRRKCHEMAEKNGHAIATELEFSDEAVSGTKRERAGLNAMLEAARAGQFRTLYLESLSRLARESVITMPMLKELVYLHRIRVISVSDGIDSSQANWELMASFMAWMAEQYLKTLRSAVLRGQEDAVLNDYSAGDWCFGYASVPIPDSEKGRRGSHPKPRKSVVIHDEHAKWVRQIFDWYIEDPDASLDGIARKLTRLGVPKDHRATTPGWHHASVKLLLRNTKYIGIWSWGQKTNVRNPMTGQIYQEDRPPEEVAKWVRVRPHLRIVEDDVFCRAQAKLDLNDAKDKEWRTKKGRLHGSREGSARPRHLLQGIIKCAACKKIFHVSGDYGSRLGCSGYKRGLCECATRIPRQLAEELIVGAIARQIEKDEDWIQMIIAETQRAWANKQRDEPDETKAQEAALAKVNQRIQRLVDEIENGDVSDDLRDRLKERRKEQQHLAIALAGLRNRAQTVTEPPTEEWIRSQLKNLVDVLRAGGPQSCRALKKLIGTIWVTETAREGRKRKVYVGVFSLSGAIFIDDGKSSVGEDAVRSSTLTIRFEEPPKWFHLVDQIKELYDAGRMFRQIAEDLKCPESWVYKGFAKWHQQRGLPVPDGTQCLSRLRTPNEPELIADRVKELLDRKLHIQDIARELGCHRDTVTAAIRHWHESRGLVVPDGRIRRKELGLRNTTKMESPRAPEAVAGDELSGDVRPEIDSSGAHGSSAEMV